MTTTKQQWTCFHQKPLFAIFVQTTVYFTGYAHSTHINKEGNSKWMNELFEIPPTCCLMAGELFAETTQGTCCALEPPNDM